MNGRTKASFIATELARVFIDAPDTPATRKFFRQYKQVLKDRYRQVEIWMTTYPIGVV